MSIAPGVRLGPYEIVAAIGAGGMGEVYRARDTRLDRTVAIKVLPASFASDTDRRERFTREAKAISSLDHPHICALYDVGEEAGTAFLVMQYLEGETLEQRLVRGALPTADALRHAIEIAEALDRAHRQGVVHRDLKPGNIMLTKGGVKVLDFGLAKISASAIAGAGASALPTTPPITVQGSILGTFQYMSPEQLEGAAADHRADIFAFGGVLYEMLTGKRAFEGRSQASLISAIMSGTPASLSSLQPLAPPALERIVMKCLEKDPERRWQSAADLADELRWATSGSTVASSTNVPSVTTSASTARSARALRAVVAILGVALIAVASLWLRDRSRARAEPPRSITFMTTLPDGWALAPTQLSGSASAPIAVSPDGQKIAIVGLQGGTTRKTQIWIHALDSLTATPLTGTDGGAAPFWSPDGRYLGFFADGQLKKVDARGGPVVTLCPADSGLGASWGSSGTIVFTPGSNSVLMQVPATGGVPVAATKFGPGETTHWRPSFLPDGRHFIYRAAIVGQRGPFFVASIDSTDSKPVLQADSSNAVYSKGHLLFMLGPTLMAQPFDVESLTLSGGPVPIADRVETQSGGTPNGLFSVSDSGLLAYRTGPGSTGSELVWFDRSGKVVSKVGEPARYMDVELSPDEKRLAVAIREGAAAAAQNDVWIVDLERNVRSRFTSDPADEGGARWTPDGKQIAYYVAKKGLFIKPSGSSSSEHRLIDGDLGPYPDSWTPDQRALLYELNDERTSWDIWVLPVSPEGKPRPLIQAPQRQEYGRISPNGRWVAYRSNESGREEVFVVPYPGPGDKVQVSSRGGKFPRWRRDGKELFYLNADNRMIVAAVDGTGPAFKAGAETALFDAIPVGANWPYDVSADGQRFLISSRAEQASSMPITVVVNWTAALK